MVIDGVMLLLFALTVAVGGFRRTQHPRHARASSDEIGLCAVHTLFGSDRRIPVRDRLPRAALHEQSVPARWRQALGSTMHYVAGDGIAILAGAVIGALIALGTRPRTCAVLRLWLDYLPGTAYG